MGRVLVSCTVGFTLSRRSLCVGSREASDHVGAARRGRRPREHCLLHLPRGRQPQARDHLAPEQVSWGLAKRSACWARSASDSCCVQGLGGQHPARRHLVFLCGLGQVQGRRTSAWSGASFLAHSRPATDLALVPPGPAGTGQCPAGWPLAAFFLWQGLLVSDRCVSRLWTWAWWPDPSRWALSLGAASPATPMWGRLCSLRHWRSAIWTEGTPSPSVSVSRGR